MRRFTMPVFIALAAFIWVSPSLALEFKRCQISFEASSIDAECGTLTRPENPAKEKIKKKENTLQINLVKNPDIATELGKQKKNQFHIGFALETTNEEVHAQEKLKKKNFDLIVLNSLNDKGAGFQNNTNKVTFFDKNNNEHKFELKSKTDVAQDIVDYVIKNFK